MAKSTTANASKRKVINIDFYFRFYSSDFRFRLLPINQLNS